MKFNKKIKNIIWLKQEHPLPKKSEILILAFLIALPNLVFLILAFYGETSRPLINIDYLVIFCVMVIPYAVARILGSILFIFAMLIDVLMFVIQIFPFLNIAAIRYLASFVSIAPNEYLIIIGVFTAVIIIIFSIIFYLSNSKRINKIYSQFILIIFIIISYVFMSLGVSYNNFKGILGRNNYYIANSQSKLYQEMTQTNFWKDANAVPRLFPYWSDKQRSVNFLQSPESDKILYIVAESWGVLRNIQAQHDIMWSINTQRLNLEFVRDGVFQASGATVTAELRELCNLRISNNGFALSQTEQQKFANCLPNQLAEKGFKTYALHGTSGLLYDRTDWYKKAGFKHTWFGENFLNLRRCTAFKGVCDSELINVVGQSFQQNAQNKIFFYWMTLTSHQPYSEKDIKNHRFDCKKYNMKETGDACHNAQLQAQFFDDLAHLIQKPEMQGVEVMVVGDHQPPVWGDEIRHIRPLMVSYLHFKTKTIIK